MDEKDRQFFESLLAKQAEQSDRRMDVLLDHFDHKLNLVVEGQQMLAERMDRMEERLDNRIDQVEKRLVQVEASLVLVEGNLAKKIDSVAVDLSAHR